MSTKQLLATLSILLMGASVFWAQIAISAEGPLVDVRVEFDREVLPADRAHTAVVKVSLGAPIIENPGDRPPINVSLVIDRSGSMQGDKIIQARTAALEALKRLAPQDIFSVVVYSDSVTTLVPAQRATNLAYAENRIRSIYASGSTALFGAVSQAAAEVRKNTGRNYIHRVILLSDGIANVGPSSPADLGRMGAALVKEGISVTTIGFGSGFNEDLMARLAERSDGNHYFVESGQDLARIFAIELGDVQNVVARSVRIELECDEGVRPIRIIGRDGRISGNTVEIRLNQLSGGQEKYALIEVEISPQLHNTKKELVRASLSYENALSGKSEHASALGRASFSRQDKDVKGSANPTVQKAYTDNEMAEARDEALTLYNEGKKNESAEVLRSVSEKIISRNQAMDFDDLAVQGQVLEEEAKEFEQDQIDTLKKKDIRSRSYETRQQMPSYRK